MKKNEQRNPLVYGIIGAIVGGIAVWFLTTSAVTGVRSGQNAMFNSESIDAHFIEQMIPHHQDAITMANLALQNAERQEVKTLAQNIIDAQTNEIEKMQDWYEDWFGREVSTGNEVMGQHGMMGSARENSLHMGMMGDATDSTRLVNAEDFDREFVRQMMPHHQMAVMMASMLKTGTQRPEMKKLANDIIAAQTSEINQMRGWLQEWE